MAFSSRPYVPAVLGLLLIATPTLAGDQAQVVARGAEVVSGPAVPHIFYGDVRDLPTKPEWEAGDPIVVNPRRWTGYGSNIVVPEQRDPLLDIQAGARRGPSNLTEVHNFDGLDFNSIPPDPTGDVGAQYFIQSVNSSPFAIYDKVTGTMVAGPTAMDSLGSGACANGAGDPIVVYDDIAGRWLMSEFSGSANALCVYISMGPDPVTDGWCGYQFNTGQFPDYPKYSVWSDAYYVTSNEGGGVPAYALDRENMVSCGVARPIQRLTAPRLTGLGFQAFTPADIDGTTPPPADSPGYMMRHRDTELHGPAGLPSTDILEIFAFDVDWDTPANSTLTQLPDIVTSEFDSNLCPPLNVFSCIPQPGTGTRLDPLLEVIMFRVAYRNFGTHETLVGVLQTDIGNFPDHSGERWYELRKGEPEGGGDWSLFQEGTYSPDDEHRFMATIAQDVQGNILMAYNVSSTTVFPSIRYTGRLEGDAAGTMPEPETTLVAGTASNSFNRYGDYSQMGVDPVDGCTFWLTAEYNVNSSSSTRIGAVKFTSCVADLFSDGFESGDTTAWSSASPPPPPQ